VPRKRKKTLQPEQVLADLGVTAAPAAPAHDPPLEAKLLEDVLSLFLTHFARDGQAAVDAGFDLPLRNNSIAPEEIEDLLRHLDRQGAASPLDLHQGLEGERLWILIDLARNGPGLARQRATVELREIMARRWRHDGVDRSLLDQLVDLLRNLRAAGDGSVLFQMLQVSAAQALVDLGGDQPGKDR
jgi:hypothetical protein